MNEAEVAAAAIESRLFDLQMQIDRFIRLANAAQDSSEQDRCWRAAQDLQLEARRLRQELAQVSAPPARQPRRWFSPWKLHRAPSR
jgi:ABC-type bacteriocin/lantibiotic exporter with double-glycine peptidase domain